METSKRTGFGNYLPSVLLERVDRLIGLIAEEPVITTDEQERLNCAFR